MRYIYGVEIWTAESRCLGSRSRSELVGGHGYRGNSEVL
jgi:hypothetical protein